MRKNHDLMKKTQVCIYYTFKLQQSPMLLKKHNIIIIKIAPQSHNNQYNIMQSKDQQQKGLTSIFSLTEQTIHLFTTIMKPQYSQSMTAQQLEDDIAKFYNGLIWAEKKNPLLLYQMFEMKTCQQIVEKYVAVCPVQLLRNSILLMNNCEPGGLVAQQLMEAHYPHLILGKVLEGGVLKGQFGQQISEYIGSFLKCYYKLFRVQWLNKFILQGQYFQLLQINLKYYNCPQFMARTSALNIVLDLLKLQPVRKFVATCKQRQSFYKSVFKRMCKLFRNELAEFGLRIAHISKHDNIQLIFSQLQDKISLWMDFSNNFAGMESFLQLSFCGEVLFPLVIGPIQTNQMPLFSLKYSLFVVKRLLPIMRNLHILEIYIRMLFIEQSVLYDQSCLRKAFIQPFSLQKLLTKQIIIDEPDELQIYNKVRQMYTSIFNSKDNHFILMINSLLSQLFKQAQQCPTLCLTYGFDYNGQMSIKFNNILLNQLKQIHQLYTIECILHTLISINKSRSLQTQLQNQYIYIYQHIISQLSSGLTPGQSIKKEVFMDNIRFLAECVEYDIDIVKNLQFVCDESEKKYERIYKIVFQWETKKQELASKQFYSRVPDCASQYLRYMFVKLMLLEKARILLVDDSIPWTLHEQYYEKMITRCPYMAEDQYNPFEIQQSLHICELSTSENTPTASYFIRDDNFLVLGIPKGQKIVITHGIKIKHASIEDMKKKKIRLKIKQWSSILKEVIEIEELYIKYDEIIIKHLQKRIQKSIEANIEFVKSSLKKTGNQLPSPSLI